MIAFDANILGIALCSTSGDIVDPSTKQQIDRPTDRVNLLIAELDAKDEQILIPMPALAEFLVMVGASGHLYLDEIHKLPRFVLGDFKEKAAIEISQVIRKALESIGKQKRDDVQETWAKVNFDRQIVAIAKAYGCITIYSTDGHVKKHASKMNLDCVHLADLPLPPEPPIDPQMAFSLSEPPDSIAPQETIEKSAKFPATENEE
jgi:hypothetical protein